MGWGSTLSQISPSRLMVTISGEARLRVQGRVYGFVQVGGERRWRWGHFDESFVVQPAPGDRVVTVVVSGLGGLGGRTSATVGCDHLVAITPPKPATALPRFRVSVPSPRTAAVTTRLPAGPRLYRLAKASVAPASGAPSPPTAN